MEKYENDSFKKPAHRPSIYSKELADKICSIVASDTDCLDEICAKYDYFPVSTTIYQWRLKYEEFSKNYLQAKQLQGELYAEETIKIAKEKSNYIDSEGNKRIDPGYVAWQKLNVNTRQWHAAKLAPKIYGDRVHVQNTNNEETEQLKIELKELREKLAEKSKSEY